MVGIHSCRLECSCVCLLVELSRAVRRRAVATTHAHAHISSRKPLVIRTCYYSKIEMVILLFPFEIRLHALQRALVTGTRHTQTLVCVNMCVVYEHIQSVFVRLFSYGIYSPGFGVTLDSYTANTVPFKSQCTATNWQMVCQNTRIKFGYSIMYTTNLRRLIHRVRPTLAKTGAQVTDTRTHAFNGCQPCIFIEYPSLMIAVHFAT